MTHPMGRRAHTALPPATLAVLVATEAEATPWRSILPRPHPGPHIEVIVTGVGRAGDALVRQTIRRAPAMVLGFGFAGALGADLGPGTLVAIDACLQPGERPPMQPVASATSLLQALRAHGLHPGIGACATLDAPLHDARQRDRLHRETGALVIEMENAHRQRVAAAAGVPFAAVCVVSDRADLALPQLRHRLIGPHGRIRWSRWLAALREQQLLGATTKQRQRLLRARADWLRATCVLAKSALALAHWWDRRRG